MEVLQAIRSFLGRTWYSRAIFWAVSWSVLTYFVFESTVAGAVVAGVAFSAILSAVFFIQRRLGERKG